MVRVKRRYIVLQIDYNGKQKPQDAFMKELNERIIQTYGDFGYASFRRGSSIKKYDPKDGYMILCVRKGVQELVMSVAPLIASVDKSPCSVTIIHLSGTMRVCLREIKKNYINNIRLTIAKGFAKKSNSNYEKMELDSETLNKEQ